MIRRAAIFFALLFSIGETLAQNQIIQDYSRILNIPNVKTMEASSSHLYVLSESDGMAVFRTYEDSLQWLYTSSGMQRRGHLMDADIRFAYLYGDSRRLTVLEPTSVLGVYSSTLLPARPLGAARLQNDLFIALGSEGLGKLSLETPETVDSDAELVANDIIGRADVLDVASSIISNQLFVLTSDSKIHVFMIEEDEFGLESTVVLSNQIHSLFLDEGLIWGATNTGQIFEVNANGLGKNLGNIEESVTDLVSWRNHVFARGVSGKIWISTNERSFQPWKSDPSSMNHITKSSYTVWLNIFNKLSPLKIGTEPEATTLNQPQYPARLKIEPVSDLILTYPKPLLLGIEFEGNYPADDVELTYRSNVKNASLKKQGLYWQPNVNQVGFNWFTIIATNSKGETDSVRFSVDVRTFNSPPRFSPVRGSSIVVNDPYEITFNAVDPENPTSSIIRYLGVDLPEGANLNERTGVFTWTPTERQIGKTTFRVIATDAQGAASSQDITFTVIDISREG
ncbi:MAG: Ig domain-containing protein [Balneola sp.]